MVYNLNSSNKYKKKNIKRIPLDVQKEWYDTELLPAVQEAQETVNGYIKKAVQDRINHDRRTD